MVGVASHTSTRVACASVAGSQPPSDSGMSSCGGDVCRSPHPRSDTVVEKVAVYYQGMFPTAYAIYVAARVWGASPRVQSAERGEPFQVGGEGSGFACKRKQSAWIN